jgi:gentisate 1,2-dioxygenase
MPTMAVWIMQVPKGFETAPIRSSDGIVMAIAEGRGSATIRDKTFKFGPNDVHVIPAWSWRTFHADDDCVLFCFSDRVAQEKLGLFHEDRR